MPIHMMTLDAETKRPRTACGIKSVNGEGFTISEVEFEDSTKITCLDCVETLMRGPRRSDGIRNDPRFIELAVAALDVVYHILYDTHPRWVLARLHETLDAVTKREKAGPEGPA